MEKKVMTNNMEIFVNFLANNHALAKYIVAYTKRYNICYNPFYLTVKRKADRNPKGLFSEILGSGHSLKKIEKKWLEYIEDTINYVPQPNDYVYCSYYDEDMCASVSWVTQFASGTKEEFTDTQGKINNAQTFVKRATKEQTMKYINQNADIMAFKN